MKVKIIARKRSVVIVEWIEPEEDSAGTYRRAVLPLCELQAINGHTAEHANPDVGIPYGVPWEELLLQGGMPEATAHVIANELRRLGIWNLVNLQADAETARAAFQKAYGMDVQRLIAAARQRHSGGQT